MISQGWRRGVFGGLRRPAVGRTTREVVAEGGRHGGRDTQGDREGDVRSGGATGDERWQRLLREPAVARRGRSDHVESLRDGRDGRAAGGGGGGLARVRQPDGAGRAGPR